MDLYMFLRVEAENTWKKSHFKTLIFQERD
jgi:hypothetical protein